jgi:hypothetical protein
MAATNRAMTKNYGLKAKCRENNQYSIWLSSALIDNKAPLIKSGSRENSPPGWDPRQKFLK